MKTRIFLLGFVFTLFIIGCSKDNNDVDNSISAAEVQASGEIDFANEEISQYVEEQADASITNPSGRVSNAAIFWPSCANITTVRSTVVNVMTITKTIDFGTTGCVSQIGNSLRGIITLNYTATFNPNNTALPPVISTLTCTFTNFYHNNIKIEGTKTFTRTMVGATVANAGHPNVRMTMNLTITHPNGTVRTRTGWRNREFVEGFYTPASWTDNQYLITGEWATSNGTHTHTSVITTPVRIKMNCTPSSVFCSGVISMTRGTNLVTLDYGTGLCDNVANLTINGVTTVIPIR